MYHPCSACAVRQGCALCAVRRCMPAGIPTKLSDNSVTPTSAGSEIESRYRIKYFSWAMSIFVAATLDCGILSESGMSPGKEIETVKTETFEAVAEQAYGKKLDTPIPYSGSFQAYETFQEVQTAGDALSHDEQVKVRNVERKANARQKALQAALDKAEIVKPTTENDPQLRLKRMYELFVANGSGHDEARQLASSSLNIAWTN